MNRFVQLILVLVMGGCFVGTVAHAELILSKPHVAFWPEKVGHESIVYPVYITNLSRDWVEVDMFNDCDGSFAISLTSCPREIEPMDGCTLHLRFRPTTAGPHSCTVHFEDSTGTTVSLPLSGMGL